MAQEKTPNIRPPNRTSSDAGCAHNAIWRKTLKSLSYTRARTTTTTTTTTTTHVVANGALKDARARDPLEHAPSPSDLRAFHPDLRACTHNQLAYGRGRASGDTPYMCEDGVRERALRLETGCWTRALLSVRTQRRCPACTIHKGVIKGPRTPHAARRTRQALTHPCAHTLKRHVCNA